MREKRGNGGVLSLVYHSAFLRGLPLRPRAPAACPARSESGTWTGWVSYETDQGESSTNLHLLEFQAHAAHAWLYFTLYF